MSDVVKNTDTPFISDSMQNRIGFQTSKEEEADIIIPRTLCTEEEKDWDRKNDHCVRGREICASDCIRPEQIQHELQNVLGESSSYHKSSDCEDLSEDLHSNKPDNEDKGDSSDAELDSGLDGSKSDPSIAGDPDQDLVVNLHHREDGCCRDEEGGKSNETDGSGHDGGSSSSGNSEQNGGGENSQSGGRDEGSQGGASGGSDGGGGGAGGGGGGGGAGGGGGGDHPDRKIEEKSNPRKKKKKTGQKKHADQHGESSDDEACLQSSPTGRLVHNQPDTSDSVSGLSEDRPQSAPSPDSSNTSSVNDGVVRGVLWTKESTHSTSVPRGNDDLQLPASLLPVQNTQETMRVPIQCTENSVEDSLPGRPVSSPPVAAECNSNCDEDHKIGGGPPIQCSEDVVQTRRAGATVARLPSHHNSERCQLDLVHISPGNLFNLRPNAGLLRQCEEDVHKERLRRAVEENRRLCRRLSCQACFRYRYRYLLWPCAHLVCQDCAVENDLCPKCRKTIEQRIGVSNGP